MDHNYLIIYQKYNGDLLYRSVKGYPHYHKGDTTSMGWKVLDIQKMYKGKIYSLAEYDNRLCKRYNIKKLLSGIDYTTLLKWLLVGVVLYIIYVKL